MFLGGKGDGLMKKPKMILFDCGQMLVDEAQFDGVQGTECRNVVDM